MPAANTDLFRYLARRWVGQIGSGGVADATTQTIPLASTTNLPTGTAVTAVIDRVDVNGTATPTKEETIIAVVSGSNLVSSLRGQEGTAQAHDAGAVVEILVTALGYNDMIDGILQDHTQLGYHKNLNDANGNAWIRQNAIASAVNHLMVGNAVTGSDVIIQASGTDANIQMDIFGKGTKGVQVKDLVPKVVVLTDAATIATNAALGNYFTVTITDNRAFGVPTNPTDGQIITYEIKQDATGSRIPTWSSSAGGFSFGAGSAPTLSTGASKVDLQSFRYSATVGKWLDLGNKLGY